MDSTTTGGSAAMVMMKALKTIGVVALFGTTMTACGVESSTHEASATQGHQIDDGIWRVDSQSLTVHVRGGMPNPDGETPEVDLNAQVTTMTRNQLTLAKQVRPVDRDAGSCAEDMPEIIVKIRDANGSVRSYRSQYNQCDSLTGSMPLVEHEALMELVGSLSE